MKEEFTSLLIDWYNDNARSLPWRGYSDPYAIWVSEIMLQQTRVDTVIPYFQRWLQLFPDINSLAQADEQAVLKAWEGLGYYSRARAMIRAARQLVQQNGGVLPANIEALSRLPGIGPYTAAAIASIAFGLDHAVVDGNVKRVLARLLPYTDPVNTPHAEKELRQIAQEWLPIGQAGDYNQAMMELGALICLPRSPKCLICPVSRLCEAFAQRRQTELPVMKEKAAVPHITVTAGIIRQDEKVLITLRPTTGLLGGMWEFPGGKVEDGETHGQALSRELQEELGIKTEPGGLLGRYQHAYTHFRVTLFAYFARITTGTAQPIHPTDLRWVNIHDLENFPMGKIDRMISRDLAKYGS